MTTIFLIGFMGAGKTTIAKELAKKLDYNVIDLDEYIEKKHNTSIEQLFHEKGENGFRALEKEALAEIVKTEKSIIATGGGTPCFYNNMEVINQHGISIYLKLGVENLMERIIESKQERPLIKGMGPHQLKEFIAQTLAVREPYYMQANYKLKVKDLQIGALADFIKAEMFTAPIN